MLKLSRRNFMRIAAVAVVTVLLAALRSVTERLSALQPRSRQVVVPAELQQDVTFAGDVIVCRTDNGPRALSARCPHLGCRITHYADGLLVCPCHGSRFHLDGSVARGPAARPLEVLPHRFDRAAGTIVIQAS
jgi:nitrite reductase/ring-hydroxylating ferredoxin subunit